MSTVAEYSITATGCRVSVFGAAGFSARVANLEEAVNALAFEGWSVVGAWTQTFGGISGAVFEAEVAR